MGLACVNEIAIKLLWHDQKGSQVAADQADDHTLDAEIEGLIHQNRGSLWVIAPENNQAGVTAGLNADAFEGGFPIHEAGADPPDRRRD